MDEILSHFKISKGTLYKWIDKGCPVHYVGKLAFFDVREIEAWVKGDSKNELQQHTR